ncbi:MgtC/SapB family protein [Pseudochelatococcus sp. G4_1912]|uniref:MgtC/SapB family protein n=1 Tax=Pseudochelatococcus sp. G4_1912 TaxID=3114288 RepID=UPI0039C69960
MQFVNSFNFLPFLDSIISFSAAFVFGTVIGVERQYRQRTAGLRTVVLVTLGAAGFVDLAHRLAGSVEAVRVIAYVVSGIGFLGAGVIMKEGLNVRGLNTAATLWCAAAVGACAGTDMIAEAGLLTLFVLVANTMLRPLVNAINRIPINEEQGEATYEVRVTAMRRHVPEVRAFLLEALEAAEYPVGNIALVAMGEERAEIVATLISTAVVPDEINAVITTLKTNAHVLHASWESSLQD